MCSRCAARRAACWPGAGTQIDLARLAGLAPAAVLCELMNSDGTMARGARVRRFARSHAFPTLTIAELVAYREATESVLACLRP